MRRKHLQYLSCPGCLQRLVLTTTNDNSKDDRVRTGTLECLDCHSTYPIEEFIPRFVPKRNYAASFGYQWNVHSLTQLDSKNGTTISRDRFFYESRWPENLRNEIILEVGCGSGRFTEIAAETGATVVAFDYSSAVDANYRSNGHRDNVLLVQANLYEMPFCDNTFDRLFCFGVLQHTPNVGKSVLAMYRPLKPGASIAADVYRKGVSHFRSFYAIRPLSRRIPHRLLYSISKTYVTLMWRFTGWMARALGSNTLSWYLLVADYRGVLPLDDRQLKEFAILDTFDLLSPIHDHPQTFESTETFFRNAGFDHIEIEAGFNGIDIRAKAPSETQTPSVAANLTYRPSTTIYHDRLNRSE